AHAGGPSGPAAQQRQVEAQHRPVEDKVGVQIEEVGPQDAVQVPGREHPPQAGHQRPPAQQETTREAGQTEEESHDRSVALDAPGPGRPFTPWPASAPAGGSGGPSGGPRGRPAFPRRPPAPCPRLPEGGSPPAGSPPRSGISRLCSPRKSKGDGRPERSSRPPRRTDASKPSTSIFTWVGRHPKRPTRSSSVVAAVRVTSRAPWSPA